MQLIPGKFGGAPSLPPPPPPPPTAEDPAIKEAKDKQRKAELERKGRRATVITGGQGVQDELGSISRPEARSGAKLLGG